MPRYNAEIPSEANIYIGQQVRRIRLMQGLSQQIVAEACGISFQSIQKYERGETQISASRLCEIAKALACPVTALLPAPGDHPVAAPPRDPFRNNPTNAQLFGLVPHLTLQQRTTLLQVATSFVANNNVDEVMPVQPDQSAST